VSELYILKRFKSKLQNGSSLTFSIATRPLSKKKTILRKEKNIPKPVPRKAQPHRSHKNKIKKRHTEPKINKG